MTRAGCVLAVCAALCGCSSNRSQPKSCGSSSAPASQPRREMVRYAVLVNGDTEVRHRENVRMAFETLASLGYAKERIFVLTPPSKRLRLPPGVLRLAPAPKEFVGVMDKLAAMVEPGDQVAIYGTGHGDTSTEGESLLELHRGELWAYDLRDQVERLRGDVVIVMDQCFSGGFADAFDGIRARAIVATSVDAEHETDCSRFAETFWKSFRDPVRVDTNRDGKASVREAFAAALSAHQKALADDPDLHSNGIYRTFNGLEDATLN